MAGNLFLKIDFGASPSTDTGARPYTGAHPFWDNTSIFLSGGVSQTETKVGQPTTVKVRVSNTFQEPIDDVRVDAYLMNPFVGVMRPQNALVRLRSNLASIGPGSGAPIETDPHVLEGQVAGANGPEPWVPTPAQLDVADHLCLIANCYSDGGDGTLVPDGTAFDPVNDAHQGQRNIHILAATMFAPEQMQFLVMPPPDLEALTFIDILPVPVEAMSVSEKSLLASHPLVVTTSGKGLLRKTLGVKDADGQLHPIHFSAEPLRARVTVKGAEPGRIVKLPGFSEPRLAVLQVKAPQKNGVGTVNAIDIVQRTEKGETLGGLRILRLATD